MLRVAVVGARGHTGAQLLELLANHTDVELAFVGSRSLAGNAVPGFDGLCYSALDAGAVAHLDVAAIVLALPNGASHAFVEGIADDIAVIDLSADHRFDDRWRYGLVELHRSQLVEAKRIANPGCYATAAQVTLAPFVNDFAEAPRIFGVSGYSGAGSTPSPRNDPEKLRDNLMPYAPTGHTHEREIGHHLAHAVHFMPHVAPFFRGITLTIDVKLRHALTKSEIRERLLERYADEPLVDVIDETPLVRDAVGSHRVTVGGIATDDKRVVFVATIDNLLKGAATQALQNLNLALGLDERAGLDP